MEECRKCREPLENIQARLELIQRMLEKKQNSNPESVFFDNQEFIQLMNISKRTAQEWRTTGIIAFSQVGCKMYYRLSDILQMLEKYHKPSKS
ncbi:MAG: helix-turn-helix domain-containing protein [Bacteroidota bacterium]